MTSDYIYYSYTYCHKCNNQVRVLNPNVHREVECEVCGAVTELENTKIETLKWEISFTKILPIFPLFFPVYDNQKSTPPLSPDAISPAKSSPNEFPVEHASDHVWSQVKPPLP